MELSNIPVVGWIVIGSFLFLVLLIIISIVVGLFVLFFKKNIKTKLFEISSNSDNLKKEIKDKFRAEGKDLVDNQSQVAKLLLKRCRIKLFEAGIQIFDIKEEKDKAILELITYRIIDKLNFEVRQDFVRNHITYKNDAELNQYINAKTKAYYCLITEKLYLLNNKLPEYDLPRIMGVVDLEQIREIMTSIYYSGREIAGSIMGVENE